MTDMTLCLSDPDITPADLGAVLHSPRLSHGPAVERFERSSRAVGARFAIYL